MNRFQVYPRIGPEMFTQLGNKYIHTPAQEIIIFSPNIHKYFFPLEYLVHILCKEIKKVCFFLCEVYDLGAIIQFQFIVVETEFAYPEFCLCICI